MKNAIFDILDNHWHAYVEKYGDAIPSHHVRVAEAILSCRTGAFGVSMFECEDCGEVHTVNNCCGNRHCPSCQQHKGYEWLEKQNAKRLPVEYFMVTFTVPKEVRMFIRSNQKICYNAMFKAASETLKKLMKDPKYVGTEMPGFMGVLHTWGRDLCFHPHIHFIVPGGGLSKDKKEWLSSRSKYLINVKAASAIFRAKFFAEIEKAGLGAKIDYSVRYSGFNVNCESKGDGENALNYLAKYVFKVGISDSRIVSHNDEQVVIRVTRSDTGVVENVKFKPLEFIRRFLQHVLPDGLMKVRHYGFLSPNSSVPINDIRRMIDELWTELELLANREKPEPPPPKYECKCGSHKLKFMWHCWQIAESSLVDLRSVMESPG